jgi:hypothetical protein
MGRRLITDFPVEAVLQTVAWHLLVTLLQLHKPKPVCVCRRPAGCTAMPHLAHMLFAAAVCILLVCMVLLMVSLQQFLSNKTCRTQACFLACLLAFCKSELHPAG